MSALGSVFSVLRYLPATLARQTLSKADPRFNSFFVKALGYGIDADSAIEYLKERFGNSTNNEYKENLDEGASRQTLRPDEMLSRSEIKNQEIPGKIAKGALSAAIGIGGASQKAKGNVGKKIAEKVLGAQGQQQIEEQPEPPISKRMQIPYTSPSGPQINLSGPPASPSPKQNPQQEAMQKYYNAKAQPQVAKESLKELITAANPPKRKEDSKASKKKSLQELIEANTALLRSLGK